MMRQLLAPSVRDASTNSRSVNTSVLARTSRAIGAMDTTPMANAIVQTVRWLVKVMMARASSSAGKASSTSMAPISRVSMRPLKKPEISPTVPPMISPSRMAETPTVSDTWAPWMIRESWSRPRSSVPSQYWLLGPCFSAL